MLAGLGLAAAGGCTNFVANRSNADGVTLFQRGQYQEALQQFQAATYADPNNADGYYNLGATYHRLAQTGDQRQHNDCLVRSRNKLSPVPGTEPEPSRLPPRSGGAADRREPADRGVRLHSDLGRESPSLADPCVELARLYQEHGNLDAAANMLAEAVRRNPEDARQWAAMGKLREESRNYAQALRNYQQSLELNPNQPDVSARVAALQTMMAHQPLALPAPPGSAPAGAIPGGAAPVAAPNATPPIVAGQSPAANR